MSLSIPAILNMLDYDARSLAEVALREAAAPPYCQYGVDRMRSMFNTFADPSLSKTPIHDVSDVVIEGPGGPIGVRCYRPTPEENRPVIVYLHGGGFVLGTLDGVDDLCRTLSAETGCVVVSVDYRLAPEHPFPAGADDCLAVFEWLERNAGSLGADGSRIAVAGDSAGGNLALSVCTSLAQAGKPMPRCLVLVYPATSDAFAGPSWDAYEHCPGLCKADAVWFWEQYIGDVDAQSEARAVPMLSTTLGALPPTLLVAADVDPLLSDIEQFAELALTEGAEIDLRKYEGVMHGFFTEVRSLRKARIAASDAAKFLGQHLL